MVIVVIQATGLQVLKSFFKVWRQSVSLWPLLMYACRSVSSEEWTMFDGKGYLWIVVPRLRRPLSVRRRDPAEQASLICQGEVG